jgi:hypothetical protein
MGHHYKKCYLQQSLLLCERLKNLILIIRLLKLLNRTVKHVRISVHMMFLKR